MLSATSTDVFFLMGAMTIVEVVDAHDGFNVITDKIEDDENDDPAVADRICHVLSECCA